MSNLGQESRRKHISNGESIERSQYRTMFGVVMVLFILVFSLSLTIWYFYANRTNTIVFNDYATIEGEGYTAYITQRIVLDYGVEPTSASPLSAGISEPQASARTGNVYNFQFDSSSGLVSNSPITIDTTRYFEPTGALKMKTTSSADRLQNPVNLSTNVNIEYDETNDLAFYYYISPPSNYKSQPFAPFVVVFVTISNSTDNFTIGYTLFGNDRNDYAGGFGTTYGTPDLWVNKNTSYPFVWSTFLVSNMRSVVSPYLNITDIGYSVESVDFYMGYDDATKNKKFEVWFDYLSIYSKPISTEGSAWYDGDDILVKSYHIETNYTIIALADYYNITTSGVFCNMTLFIENYLTLNKLSPNPAEDGVISDLLVYLDAIDIPSEDTNITTTTYEDNDAYQIEGKKSSMSIPLIDNKFLGNILEYTFQANYTVLAQQISNEWSFDSLDTLKDLNSFTVHTGTSVWVF